MYFTNKSTLFIKTKKALKVIDKLTKNNHELDKNKLDKIREEIKIHSMLNHPNIVKLIESFEDEQNFYMVLEFCPHGELYSYIKKHKR